MPRTAELIENCYSVEGVPQSGNCFEYLACRLQKGTPVRYKRQVNFGQYTSGTGVFVHTWNYDGINAVIETPERITLCLSCGDEIELLGDASQLNVPMMHGDGI